MSSRSAFESPPGCATSLVGQPPLVAHHARERGVHQLAEAGLVVRAVRGHGAATGWSAPISPLLPPNGSPSAPSQCSGSVPLRPRTGIVLRASSWSQPLKVHSAPITQSSWSTWPSGWQLPHEKVPVVEPAAALKAMRPLPDRERRRVAVEGLAPGLDDGASRASAEVELGDAVVERVQHPGRERSAGAGIGAQREAARAVADVDRVEHRAASPHRRRRRGSRTPP